MSAPKKSRGEAKHRVSPPLQKVGGTCPPVFPRIYTRETSRPSYRSENAVVMSEGVDERHLCQIHHHTSLPSSAVTERLFSTSGQIEIVVRMTAHYEGKFSL